MAPDAFPSRAVALAFVVGSFFTALMIEWAVDTSSGTMPAELGEDMIPLFVFVSFQEMLRTSTLHR